MPCYQPLKGWYARRRNESGKRSIVFNRDDAARILAPLSVPCGRCLGCQLERARIWALRCVHEAKLYERNCFITLTYKDECLPDGGTLVPEHFVGFMKRLRWHYGEGIRFFHCGEYGEKLGRPHHHALLFNHWFEDAEPVRRLAGASGNPLFRSVSLEKLWGHGFGTIGMASFESASYIARYTMKKFGRSDAEYGGRVKEYLTMSRRPGIGRGWFEKYRRDVYPSDECVVNGKVVKPPRYYDNLADSCVPSVMARVRSRRRVEAGKSVDNTDVRLYERFVVKRGAIQSLKRSLEE